MKRTLQIPQHEFSFAVQTFNLFGATALDGERITREREQAEQDRREAEKAQVPMFDLPRKKHSHRCQRCNSAVYCYRSQCQKPQRVATCQYCK